MALKAPRDTVNSGSAPGSPAADAGESQARFHGDVEGHRRLVSSLYIDADGDDAGMAEVLPVEERWPLHRTVLLVVLFNAAAWAGIAGTIYSILR